MKKSFVLAIASCLTIFVVSSTVGQSLARAGIVFQDDFNSESLDASWEIIRQDPTHWSLTNSPGSLQIISQEGEFWGSPLPYNVFLVDPQTEYVSLETHLTFNPTQDFQQAGLIIYVSDSNFMKFDRIWASNLTGNDVVEFFNKNNDERRTAVVTADILRLRITKSGDDYTASYSTDGMNYVNVGTIMTTALTAPRLGLFAINGSRGSPDIPADFDYFVATNSTVEVLIDIKPGSDPNCFNINGHGVIPVAILGSGDFDVYDVNLESLSFGGLEVRVRGNKGPLCSIEYLNQDAYPDLVCHFEDNASAWEPGEGEATLTGELMDATSFEGADSICVVP